MVYRKRKEGFSTRMAADFAGDLLSKDILIAYYSAPLRLRVKSFGFFFPATYTSKSG